MKIIALSVTVEDHPPCDPPSMPTVIDYWDHAKGAEHMRQFFPTATEKDLPKELGWSIEHVALTTHSGTRLDAPWHYHRTMNNGEPACTIDQAPLEWCFSDGVVLDFSDKPNGYRVVARATRLVNEANRVVATPTDARKMLDLRTHAIN